jgi:hypothetical protein
MEGEIQGIGVVFLGSFAPSLISPGWLRLHELIGPDEFTKSQVQVIIPPTSIFNVDWLGVNVTENKLVLQTTLPQEFDRIRDVAVGILRSLESPQISALGINTEMHWLSPSIDSFNNFGDVLVPKDFWQGLMTLPGTGSVTIRGVRDDQWAGSIDVTIQPSNRISPFGLFVMVNDHFVLKKVEEHPKTREDFWNPEIMKQGNLPSHSPDTVECALEILGGEWHSRREFAEETISALTALSRGD